MVRVMDPTEIPLFQLADQRLAWLDRRQGLLAQNIANADTPGYRARDLQPFAATLAGKMGAGKMGAGKLALAPVQTNPAHLAGNPTQVAATGRGAAGERAPDGNAVSLDKQLVQVADTDSAQQLTTQLYSKYMSFFRTALGR